MFICKEKHTYKYFKSQNYIKYLQKDILIFGKGKPTVIRAFGPQWHPKVSLQYRSFGQAMRLILSLGATSHLKIFTFLQ